MKSKSLAPLFALPLVLAPIAAQAQQFCLPGTPVCAGPTGVSVSPTATASTGATGQAAGTGTTTATLPTIPAPKLDYTSEWQGYFTWRARLEANVRARVTAQAQATVRGSIHINVPNPYTGPAPTRYTGEVPREGRGGGRGIHVGLLALVGGTFTGSHSLGYVGYAPPVRLPVSDGLYLSIDPAILALMYDLPQGTTDAKGQEKATETAGAVQFRPGILQEIVRSTGPASANFAYWRVGLDAIIPVGGGAAFPSAFLGPTAGIGMQGGQDIMVGAEWNVSAVTAMGTRRGDFGGLRAGTDFRIWLGLNL